MFKIGDIVRFNNELYPTMNNKLYEVVGTFHIGTPHSLYKIKNIKTEKEQYINGDTKNLELDVVSMRKLKLERICSKLEI